LTVFAAELNPVLARRLWPRALPMAPPTEADDRVMKALVAEEQRKPEETIAVTFTPAPSGDSRSSDSGGGRAPGSRTGVTDRRNRW
ncbi:MAG: hypothetical protein ACRDZ8_12770, partial [Acidimicrobiales bacterium]